MELYFFEEETLTKQAHLYRITQMQLHNFSHQLAVTRAFEAFTDEARQRFPDVSQISDDVMQIYREELYRIKSEQVRAFELTYQSMILAFYDRVQPHLEKMGFLLMHLSHNKVMIAPNSNKDRYRYFDLVFSKARTVNEWYDLSKVSQVIEICFYGANSRVHNFVYIDLFSFLEKAPEWREMYARKKGFKTEIDELVLELTPIAEILRHSIQEIEQNTGKPFATLYKPEAN